MEVQLNFANRISPLRASKKYLRDILLQFTLWPVKVKVMACYWEQPAVTIAAAQISVYSNLSVIILKKRKSFKFLTLDLQKKDIMFRWGFSFKLILPYNSKKYTIKTMTEASNLSRHWLGSGRKYNLD